MRDPIADFIFDLISDGSEAIEYFIVAADLRGRIAKRPVQSRHSLWKGGAVFGCVVTNGNDVIEIFVKIFANGVGGKPRDIDSALIHYPHGQRMKSLRFQSG